MDDKKAGKPETVSNQYVMTVPEETSKLAFEDIKHLDLTGFVTFDLASTKAISTTCDFVVGESSIHPISGGLKRVLITRPRICIGQLRAFSTVIYSVS